MMPITRPALLVSLLAMTWGCARPQPGTGSRPAAATVASEFTGYRRMTDGTVYVPRNVALLCDQPSARMFTNAVARHGPHALSGIHIYMNDPAATAFAQGSRRYPVGSVIVKRKTLLPYWNLDGTPGREAGNGVGGMIKRPPGYDPAHGDWEYFYFDNPARIDSGPMASCVRCHDNAKATDHVFGDWRTKGG